MKVITEVMTNFQDVRYSSSFYFGSQPVRAEMVYDSGTDWLWVTSTDCDTCKTNIYNQKASTSSKIVNYDPFIVPVKNSGIIYISVL